MNTRNNKHLEVFKNTVVFSSECCVGYNVFYIYYARTIFNIIQYTSTIFSVKLSYYNESKSYLS